ncbi:MAG: hypothetical protein MUC29_13265 [Pyrinomonadaceae bacterium]|jgi:hypothetical protein|nr:hypothetical protein [Pyrinomonadaceae bacterium]
MSEIFSANHRFSDNGKLIYEFGEEFLVVCPKCNSLAKVGLPETDSEKINNRLFAPRKVFCLSCLFRDTWTKKQISIGGNFDWYFGLPLWLQISCCGETLWAYNYKHLEFIENYVSANLRERTPNLNKSVASRLPKWIKSAKNRDEILKAIKKLKSKLLVDNVKKT